MNKQKPNLFSWLLILLLCCISITAKAATVNLQGLSSNGTEQGYPLFVVPSNDITVSSSAGSFDYIYIDGNQVAYNYGGYWTTYALNIDAYLDGNPHKLQLKRGSSDYGICYFNLHYS